MADKGCAVLFSDVHIILPERRALILATHTPIFALLGRPLEPVLRLLGFTEAATLGDATARTIAYRMRDRAGYYFKDSNWRLPFFGGYKFEWQPGVANLDAAAFFFFLATGVTPSMDTKIVGFVMGAINRGEYGIPEKIATIDTVGVHPEFQQAGVGDHETARTVPGLRGLLAPGGQILCDVC